MFVKCKNCGSVFTNKEYINLNNICPRCGLYGYLSNNQWLELIIDKNSYFEYDTELAFVDPIDFPQYKDKYQLAVEKTEQKEAIICCRAKIKNIEIELGIMNPLFMMSSMGCVVGEKVARIFDRATEQNKPVILIIASGGARMQEGMISLMQMNKTVAAITRFRQKTNKIYISLLTNPTTGGVSASYAFLADYVLAEPNAIIGFAGKRVIEQTIGKKLPKDFQKAESLLRHGFIDAIVRREEIRKCLFHLLLSSQLEGDESH